MDSSGDAIFIYEANDSGGWSEVYNYPISSGTPPFQVMVDNLASGATVTLMGRTQHGTFTMPGDATGCDASPTVVTIPCIPVTSCSGGVCGSISDGCGGTLACPSCAAGAVCVSGLCEETGAEGECEAEGGAWVNGKCIIIKPGCKGLCQ